MSSVYLNETHISCIEHNVSVCTEVFIQFSQLVAQKVFSPFLKLKIGPHFLGLLFKPVFSIGQWLIGPFHSL
jgi:hypothetical protein